MGKKEWLTPQEIDSVSEGLIDWIEDECFQMHFGVFDDRLYDFAHALTKFVLRKVKDSDDDILTDEFIDSLYDFNDED